MRDGEKHLLIGKYSVETDLLEGSGEAGNGTRNITVAQAGNVCISLPESLDEASRHV